MVTEGPTRQDYTEKLADDTLVSVATYTAPADPDGDSLTWSLAGSDKDDFNIGEQEGGSPGTLTFKEKPDFEKPVDANGDNIYMVTVQVSDSKLTGTRTNGRHRNRRRGGWRGNLLLRPAQGRHRPHGVPHRPRQRHIHKR